MYKCVLWGTGNIFKRKIQNIKRYESQGILEIVAVTSNDVCNISDLQYQWISKKELPFLEFDLVIVMVHKDSFSEIVKEAKGFGISEKKIVSYDIFDREELNLEKYLSIKRKPVTIFSNNCMGGITYNCLGLQFSSPFINMYLTGNDYLKFLKDPKQYMDAPLVLKEKGYNKDLDIEFPIVKCKDIILYFNHYTSLEEVQEAWERRKQRINWNNIAVMMYTEEQEQAAEFLRLPYKKKICFVSFKAKEPELCYVPFEGPLWANVNAIAARQCVFYDEIAFLHDGEIRLLHNN